ncbi:MAG TPA: hypothetical protein VHY37_09800 [Tepidisphaeraceae bacterium]|nr:hypothetical protein [Tepidisphaeraceae bacterium]
MHDDRHAVPAPASAEPRQGLLARLWRRRLLAAAVWGACVVAGFAYLLLAPSVFESVATLSASKPADGSAPPGIDALFDQVGVIDSADVVSDAVSEAGLQDLPSLRGERDPVSYLVNAMDVRVQRASLEITVGVPARWSDDSAKITNAIVGAFLTRQNRARSAQPSDQDSRQSTVHDLDAARDSALQALLEFQNANPAFITPDSADALGKRIAKLNDDLAQAQSDDAAARAEFNADKAKLADPQQASVLVQLARSKNIFGALAGQSDDIAGELGDQQKALAQQRQTMGIQNPVVVKTQTQINALNQRQSEIDQQEVLILATYLQHQIDLADARIAAIEDQLKTGDADASNYAQKKMEYDRLEQASQSADAAAAQADQRLHQIQSLGGSAAILTLSHVATPQPTPIAPRPIPVLSIALIGGFLLGVIAGMIRW